MNVKCVCGWLLVLTLALATNATAAVDPPDNPPDKEDEVQRLRHEVARLREVIRQLHAQIELYEQRAMRINVNSRWNENLGPLRFPLDVERAMQGDRFNVPVRGLERFSPYRRALPEPIERPIRPVPSPR